MSPRRLYNFRIDPDLDAGLKAVKERDGVAESEQIRRALKDWLVRKGVSKKTLRVRVRSRRQR